MIPTWIIELLDRRGVRYDVMHRPEGFRDEDLVCDEQGNRLSAARTVIAFSNSQVLELVIPLEHEVNIDALRELMHGGLPRLATPDEVRRLYPDCDPTAVPALRAARKADVIMDPAVDVDGWIVFRAGTRQHAVRIPMSDWLEIVNPRMVVFTKPRSESASLVGSA